MSKEEIIAAMRSCAKRLGRTPALRELLEDVKGIKPHDMKRNFGSYTRALRACGLEITGKGHVPEMQDLFLEWAAIARRLGHIPTIADYERFSRYSKRPLMNRFGGWSGVPCGLQAYAEENGLASEWKDVFDQIITGHGGQKARKRKPSAPKDMQPRVNRPRMFADRPVLGPPLVPSALAHGPTNEAGVLYLFGTLAQRLGFIVTQMQSGFPDCEAMREVSKDRWQRVRIEFEYESRNFLKHCHRAEECDIIVCWIHNWPDCPLDIVELRSAVGP